MTKPKTLEQLRAEKERAETQLAQEQHKLERLENRKKYLEKGERTKRTHRLCNLGGTIESLAPEVKDLTHNSSKRCTIKPTAYIKVVCLCLCIALWTSTPIFPCQKIPFCRRWPRCAPAPFFAPSSCKTWRS